MSIFSPPVGSCLFAHMGRHTYAKGMAKITHLCRMMDSGRPTSMSMSLNNGDGDAGVGPVRRRVCVWVILGIRTLKGHILRRSDSMDSDGTTSGRQVDDPAAPPSPTPPQTPHRATGPLQAAQAPVYLQVLHSADLPGVASIIFDAG